MSIRQKVRTILYPPVQLATEALQSVSSEERYNDDSQPLDQILPILRIALLFHPECDLPATCPKCDHRRAFYMQIQIRSADEPSTTFFVRDQTFLSFDIAVRGCSLIQVMASLSTALRAAAMRISMEGELAHLHPLPPKSGPNRSSYLHRCNIIHCKQSHYSAPLVQANPL